MNTTTSYKDNRPDPILAQSSRKAFTKQTQKAN